MLTVPVITLMARLASCYVLGSAAAAEKVPLIVCQQINRNCRSPLGCATDVIRGEPARIEWLPRRASSTSLSGDQDHDRSPEARATRLIYVDPPFTESGRGQQQRQRH